MKVAHVQKIKQAGVKEKFLAVFMIIVIVMGVNEYLMIIAHYMIFVN